MGGLEIFQKKVVEGGGRGGALQERVVEKIDRGCDPQKNYAQTKTHRTHRGQ